MSRARYCSDCGAPVLRPEQPDGKSVLIVCPECGRQARQRPDVSAAGILKREGDDGTEILLVRRKPDVHYGAGRYCLPGRLVEWGEDARDVVRQSFWELTGLEVEVISVYEVHSNFEDPDRLTVGTWFRVRVANENREMVPGADADQAAFFPLTRLPELAYPTERLIFQRLSSSGEAVGDRAESELSAQLHRRRRKYRELLEAYTNELMRGAWINDLHLRLSKSDSTAAISVVAARHISERVEVDEVKIWYLGPPDKCGTCPWADRCSKEHCLHLFASAESTATESSDMQITRDDPSAPEEERVPLIHGVPAADVALKDAALHAELPGAGAQPKRFEGFPLHTGGSHPGVLGLISRTPMEPNAKRLFEVVARHIGTLVRNAKLVEDLRLANQVKLGFIARMSHELKTPLTAILGYSELLREELMAEGHMLGADGAATIEESGRKLLNIVESILEIAKLQSGAVRYRPDRVDMVEKVRQAVAKYTEEAEGKGLELVFFEPEGDEQLTVWTDSDRLDQILDHLLNNAVKFTNEGRIDVRLYPEEGRITCEVLDTGIGIAPYTKTVFQAFHQVSEKIHIDYGGLGIGLSLAQILVERQGGRIWCESQRGEGSKFFFSLPRYATSVVKPGSSKLARKDPSDEGPVEEDTPRS